MLFPILTDDWLPITLQKYHNSRQNILILFWKYLVDFRSASWLYLNGKLFAVCKKIVSTEQFIVKIPQKK